MKPKSPIIFSLIVFLTLLISSPVQGQSPSPEASPTDEDVQDIREAVKEKVQEKLDELKKEEPRALVGEITEISNSTLTLTVREEEKQVKLNDEAVLLGLERERLDFEDLEIGSFAIAMGYLAESGVFDGRRIVIIEEPTPPSQIVAFGQVTDKSTEENILTVKHPKKETVWSVEVTSKTTIRKKVEDEFEEIDFEEIETDSRVVAIGETDTKENFVIARLIQVLPQE